MLRKVVLSILSGMVISLVSWVYLNYDFSFSVEDAFIKKIFSWKDRLYSSPSKAKADFLFINTGKDLALVEDTTDYGNVAVSDREKIYHFVRHLNSIPVKPAFLIVDIQFYYPYTANPEIDSLLQNELNKNDFTVIPVVKDENGNYKSPLYKAKYAYSDYRTFGSGFNKFRIINHETIPSIPIALHTALNKAKYKDHFWWALCNRHLCLSAIWPSFYIRNKDIRGIQQLTGLQGIEKEGAKKEKQKNVKAQYYNLGEMLFDMQANPDSYQQFFRNKIIFIGNFEEDLHSTPVGKMSGPVLLSNIYLSLVNGQHLVDIRFFIIILSALSALSYVAWFEKMPEVKLNFKFMFSSYVVKFIRGYISYFGCMFFLSLLVLFLFNVQIALFLPAFIFTGIEYVRQKKYLNNK